LPGEYLNYWSIDDLFEYLDMCESLEKKAKTGDSIETINNSDEMERF